MNFKKAIYFILIFVLLFNFSFLPTHAEIEPTDVIKIGYTADYGITTDAETGQKSGYLYDFLKEISKYTEWEYEFIECDWYEGLSMLKEGKLDIFGPMQKTPEREEMYDFTDYNFGYEYGTLYVLDSVDMHYNEFEKLNGMTVGCVEGGFFSQQMRKFCIDKGIEIELVYADLFNVENELKERKYDAFVSGSLFDINNTKVAGRISLEPFYYAVSKTSPNIFKKLNSALSDIMLEDSGFTSSLYKKHYGNKIATSPIFTLEQKNVINKHPKLRVACDKEILPIEYFDFEENKFKGISIDFLEQISSDCGIKFEYVEADHENTDELDFDISACLHKNLFSNSIVFTDDYYIASMVLISKSDAQITEEDRLNVGILDVDCINYSYISKKFPNLNIIKYSDLNVLTEDLNKDTIDGMIVSVFQYNEAVRSSINKKYFTTPLGIDMSLNIGVNKNLEDYRIITDILNKSIKRMTESSIDTIIFKNTVNRAYEMPLGEILLENIVIIVFLAFGILFLLVAFIIIIIKINRGKRKALQKAAYVDEVTGEATLLKFKKDAASILADSSPSEYMITVLDIDNFKFINESFGFAVGDEVLRCVAKAANSFKTENSLIARMNSDNFIFLSKPYDIADFFSRTDGSNEYFQSQNFYKLVGDSFKLSVSAGIYLISDPKMDLSIMIDYASIAKKSIKGIYGNRITEFTDDMLSQLNSQREISMDMENALKNNCFIPYIQPKYRLKDRKLVGGEILVRWQTEKNLVFPAAFIPLFEKNGFIQKLDMYMFEKTCEIIKKLKDKTKIFPRISVNVSKLTLVNDGFIDDILKIAKKYDVLPKEIEIEITESVLADNTAMVTLLLSKLKSEGFYISIDDFGSEYSSLSLLKDIKADVLKIDKGFLSDTINSQKGKLIVSNIIKLSKDLNLETVAEGVEKLEQAESLAEMGCDIVQGYYFSKPIPAEDFLNIKF